MAFFLGKDVAIKLATENGTYGIGVNKNAGSITTPSSFPHTNGNTNYLVATNLTAGGTEQGAVTSCELSIGAMDEDIAYFGMRSQTKAEIKKETTLTLTRKKVDNTWDVLYNDARYGVSGNNSAWDGLEQPTFTHGYRIFVELITPNENSVNEMVSILGACVQSHTVSVNTDGTMDETLDLMSYITPQFWLFQYTSPITSLNI